MSCVKAPLHSHVVEALRQPMLVASHLQEQEDQEEVRETSEGMMTSLHGATGNCREVGFAPTNHSGKMEMADRCA